VKTAPHQPSATSEQAAHQRVQPNPTPGAGGSSAGQEYGSRPCPVERTRTASADRSVGDALTHACELAAVDDELGNGLVAGLIAGEEHDQRRHLFRFADAAESSDLAADAQPVNHRGADDAGVDRVHPYVVLAELERTDLVSPRRANFDATYPWTPGLPCMPAVDEVFTMDGGADAMSASRAAVIPRNAPVTLMDMMRSHCSRVYSPVPPWFQIPALFTNTFRRPNDCTAVETAAAQSSGDVTSKCT